MNTPKTIVPIYPHLKYEGQRNSSGHVHADDNRDPMTFKQGLLVAVSLVVICIGLGQFLHWSDSHQYQALGLLLVAALVVLTVDYVLGFVRSRDACPTCHPSSNGRW